MSRACTGSFIWLLCLSVLLFPFTAEAQQVRRRNGAAPTGDAASLPNGAGQHGSSSTVQRLPVRNNVSFSRLGHATGSQSATARAPAPAVEAANNQTQSHPSVVEEVPGGIVDEDQGGMNLEEATRIAEHRSPNLRDAAAQVTTARGRAYQAGLYPNPTLYAASPQWTGNISQFNSFLGQDFITKGKLRLDQAAALRVVRQTEFAFQRTRFDLLTAVRQGFFSNLIAQRRVNVLEAMVEVAQKSKVAAERLLAAGQGTRIDALLLGIELDRAHVALENARAIQLAAQRQLAATLGDPNMPVGYVRGALTADLPDFEHEALQRGVIAQNALVGIAQADISRNRILLDRAIVEPYPNFNVQGGYQYGAEGVLHNQGYVQVSMMVPLWNRNQGGIRAAQGDLMSARARLGRVQNDLAGQASATLGNYQSAKQLVQKYEEDILPSAEETLRITQQAYEQGEFDFLRLLQAQRTLVEARLGYVNAQENRWLSAAEIAGLLQIEQFP